MNHNRTPKKNPIMFVPQICEGQMVPHAHTDDALEYRYLNAIHNPENYQLCSRCVKFEREQGYTLERTFSEERPQFITK